MRVHWLQHVPFEGLGAIEGWLAARGAEVTATRLHAGERLPGADACDWLISMGGPMGVGDEDAYPWLAHERRLVGEAIEAGRAVLGICLGAQIVAAALGAPVRRNPRPEIGWFPVNGVEGAHGPFADLFADAPEAFHWHGDTFDIPPGATWLAASEGCRHQAFAIGDRVVGLQFHLETTPEGAHALVEHCRHEMVPGEHVQDEATIFADPSRFARANALMERVLQRLAGDR